MTQPQTQEPQAPVQPVPEAPDERTEQRKAPALPDTRTHEQRLLDQIEVVQAGNDGLGIYMDPGKFAQIEKVAGRLAASDMVPQRYRGKPESIIIALELAHRLQANPLMVMQRVYTVNGNPGIEAQMVIALINKSGRFLSPLDWEVEHKEGKPFKATCYTFERNSGRKVSASVDMDVARAEGWIDKAGSKWKSMPEQMLKYRSAAFFARLYAPDITMGMPTTDEIHDITDMGSHNLTPNDKRILYGRTAEEIESAAVEEEAEWEAQQKNASGPSDGFDGFQPTRVDFLAWAKSKSTKRADLIALADANEILINKAVATDAIIKTMADTVYGKEE